MVWIDKYFLLVLFSMRVKLTLLPKEGNKIPWDYMYKLSGAIYNIIGEGNPKMAVYLHKTSLPKPYTFSWLFGKYEQSEGGLLLKGDTYTLFFSTIDKEVGAAFLAGVARKRDIRIGRTTFYIEDAHLVKEPSFSPIMTFKTLSPILLRGYSKDKTNPHRDLSPLEKEFFIHMKENLVKKCELFLGESLRNPLFEVLHISHIQRKRIRVKDTWNVGWMFTFTVSGTPKLLEVGYKAGFGERTALGFGMVEVVN